VTCAASSASSIIDETNRFITWPRPACAPIATAPARSVVVSPAAIPIIVRRFMMRPPFF
jgi:hypothetical protein